VFHPSSKISFVSAVSVIVIISCLVGSADNPRTIPKAGLVIVVPGRSE
jgi:hypothetical protein